MKSIQKTTLAKSFILISLLILTACDSSKKSDSPPPGPDPSVKPSCFNPIIHDDYGKIAYLGESDSLHISLGDSSHIDPNIKCKIEVSDKSEIEKINLPAKTLSPGETYSKNISIFNQVGEHELTITITDLNNNIVKNFQYHISVQKPLDQTGKILYHATFPFNANQPQLISLDLTEKKFTKLILSNFIAGVLLGNLMKEKFPIGNFNKDYVYGSIFAQLLQENIDTNSYPGALFINNDVDKKTLLTTGQGGPYQINDYAKRLPGVGTEGAVGLVNFLSLQASLGYTIQSQDKLVQNANKGPEMLDNIYFGPIAAAYFHYNDLNRLNILNLPDWGPEHKGWEKCKTSINSKKFNYLDMILNCDYNAGSYSETFMVYVDLCANPEKFQSNILSIDDYSLGDQDYIDKFQLGEGFKSMTKQEIGTTYILYPRQVRLYLDQLYNNTDRIRGISLNSSIKFTLETLKNLFKESMKTLAYLDENKKYTYISQESSDAAFTSSLGESTLSQIFDLGNSSHRVIFFGILETAFNTLESNLNFKFNEVTEEDHTVSSEL